MIILEEIEAKAGLKREEKEKLSRVCDTALRENYVVLMHVLQRETLPPYTPPRVPRRTPTPINIQLSQTLQVPLTQVGRPRSSSSHSQSFGSTSASAFSFSSSYNDSTQTLVPHQLSSITASSSQATIVPSIVVGGAATRNASVPSFSSPRRPPSYVRAANFVDIERSQVATGGPFVIDSMLSVPHWLLSDVRDPDTRWPALDVLPSAEAFFIATHSSIFQQDLRGKVRNTKGNDRKKRPNLSLTTDNGDICADVWVREGSATRGRRNGLDKPPTTDIWDVDEGDEKCYWADGWTSPPSAFPWPSKTEESVDLDVQNDRGSVTLRIVRFLLLPSHIASF